MQDGPSSDVDINASTTNNTHTIANGVNGDDHLADKHHNADASTHSANGDGPTTPRGRKRKHSETHSAKREKKPSPPWKKVEAEGVTSFVENGKRKSSRFNAVPLDLRPQSQKRQTRREYGRSQEGKIGHTEDFKGRRATDGVSSAQASHKENNSKLRKLTSTDAPSATKHKHVRSGQTQTNGQPAPPLASRQPSQPSNQHRHQQAPNHRLPKPVPKRERSLTQESGIEKRAPQSTSSDTKVNITASPEVVKISRIRLRLGPRTLPVIHPGCIPPKKKHESLKSFLEHDDPWDGEEGHRPSPREISKEASAIDRVIRAGKPGGILYGATTVESEEDVPKEYFGGYTHPDYLVKHLTDLHGRIFREGRDHRAIAKKLAWAAKAAVQARIPKTAEEIEEARRDSYIQYTRQHVLKELRFILQQISTKVLEQKRAEHEAREAAVGRDSMKRLVDRSEGLLTARTGRRSLDVQNDPTGDSDSVANSEHSRPSGDSDANSDDEDDETSDQGTSSASGDEGSEIDLDQELSAEQLRAKYARMPALVDEVRSETHSAPDAEAPARQTADKDIVSEHSDPLGSPSNYELEQVDDVMMDDEDASESDDGTEMSSEASEEDVGSDESDGDEAENPLLGFLSKQDILHAEDSTDVISDDMVPQDAPDSTAIDDSGEDAEDNVSPGEITKLLEDAVVDQPVGQAGMALQSGSDEPSRHSTPSTSATTKPSRPESMSSVEPAGEDLLAMQSRETQGDEPRIAIPSLLRGQLRPYQHAGLDWLARMYAEDTNGILADEMGLGKTFQTIALLAHLATHHQIWGPHLVVVPTSVMLNWEMEFKKFCPGFKILTYYGTQEERRAKRKGWFDNDLWHVCITSYQLALQDAVPLKRRGWHYLILDEAHNIKNFRSQRWQTLLSFKAQARLLLTGTPLQNNLSELWSLLFFLAPEQNKEGDTGFGSLQEFSKVFHHPVDQILEHGRAALDEESMNIVNKLHKVLRPHLLRRMKADVEKQMPKKYEHVTVCRLSKRQRQLYDSYMSRAGTRDSFASGNYMSIINCLMQLRKVCNHPDLFETRQTVTSFAMSKSAIAAYEITELLVRRRLVVAEGQDHRGEALNLWGRNLFAGAALRSEQLSAARTLAELAQESHSEDERSDQDHSTVTSALSTLNATLRRSRMKAIWTQKALTNDRLRQRPAFSQGLLNLLTLAPLTQRQTSGADHLGNSKVIFQSSVLSNMVFDINQRSDALRPTIQKFACVTPAVVAPNMSKLALTESGVQALRSHTDLSEVDPFHEARIRLSIAFPDKSLIQYDCGKLQQLDRLLRRLQSGGHRALIFTQMTKVLDILEQFMNLHGHRYLRLDGATKIEQRQVLTERFNTDPRTLAFILSSRSGGLGINLTGADTVIFYDLDWNPAMDKQCQDRCHRIGQTRDVHIYRFVSEGTIEANILRKSNQKRMLDDVVIQEGDFTTEYLNKLEFDNGNDEANAALDKVLGGGTTQGRALLQAEDKEDQEAAKIAQKEDVQADAADFDDRPGSAATPATTPRTPAFPFSRPETPASATPRTPLEPPAEAGATPRTPLEPPAEAGATPDTATPMHATPQQPADVVAGTREQLYEAFASQPLPQDKPTIEYKRDESGAYLLDEEGNPAEQLGFDDYLLRLMEWELKDHVHARLSNDKARKRAKKGVAVWGQIRR